MRPRLPTGKLRNEVRFYKGDRTESQIKPLNFVHVFGISTRLFLSLGCFYVECMSKELNTNHELCIINYVIRFRVNLDSIVAILQVLRIQGYFSNAVLGVV